MENMQIFSCKEFGQVRTVSRASGIWFVGKDLCKSLGYTNSRKAIGDHVDSEDKGVTICDTQGGKQKLAIINESGMYALIFGSKLESAKKFKHWVTSEVLPSIRKTGTYSKPMSAMEILELQMSALKEVNGRVDKLENTMTIDYAQQQVLGNLVSKVVIDALGGKYSTAYNEMSKKVFAECNRDVKNFFKVNSRNNIAVVDFDNAKEFIEKWEPCSITKSEIADLQID